VVLQGEFPQMYYNQLFRIILTVGSFFTLFILALFLTSCGKKGDPVPYGPKDQATFPGTYPPDC
jgi:predicted small lipoprotein YifL